MSGSAPNYTIGLTVTGASADSRVAVRSTGQVEITSTDGRCTGLKTGGVDCTVTGDTTIEFAAGVSGGSPAKATFTLTTVVDGSTQTSTCTVDLPAAPRTRTLEEWGG